MDLLREFNIDTYVTPKISKISIMKRIYESQRAQIDIGNSNIQDLINNIFIDTATWALDDWEYELGIPTVDDNYETRRARIKAKLRGYGTCTKKHIKSVCAPFVDNTEVIEHYEDYWFELILENNNGFYKFLKYIRETIQDIKPAHLGVKYKLKVSKDLTINSGMVVSSAKIQTVNLEYTPEPADFTKQSAMVISNISKSTINMEVI